MENDERMKMKFLKGEAGVGILLIIVTVFALILANSPFSEFYTKFLDIPVVFKFGPLEISKPLILWVNDGLMAIFFFLVGLEVKREILEGSLSSVSKVALPGIAALGGMMVPALIYIAINFKDPVALKGWAIPTATDIAFALGVLALLGKRVPSGLKVFLMALAVIDDLGAIIIIALFYTKNLSLISLLIALGAILGLLVLNIFKVTKKSFYILFGIILWVSVLKSGVHATLAGVVIAMFVPLKEINNKSLLKEFEHELHFCKLFCVASFCICKCRNRFKGN
jgi:NhaA family Na+:H+ antiporter